MRPDVHAVNGFGGGRKREYQMLLRARCLAPFTSTHRFAMWRRRFDFPYTCRTTPTDLCANSYDQGHRAFRHLTEARQAPSAIGDYFPAYCADHFSRGRHFAPTIAWGP